MKPLTSPIFILGLGWLGSPLAETLSLQGYSVSGTTTTTIKLKFFEDRHIQAQIWTHLDPWPITQKESILICTLTPSGYSEAILKHLIEHPGPLLFTSSTSVFSQNQGRVDEETTAHPQEENGKLIHHFESELLKNRSSSFTWIVRFGGLFGANRHPAFYLSGKTNLINAETPVNVTSLQTAMITILKIIALKPKSGIFHALENEHPSRKDFYTQACQELQLKAPHFQADQPRVQDKIVESIKTKIKLGLSPHQT